MTLFMALLFIILTPGVLLTLPAKGSPLTVAIVHGLIFGFLYHFTYAIALKLTTPPGVCISGACNNGVGSCVRKGNGDTC